MATDFSHNLDMNTRFDTGRKFGKMTSKPSFFNSGKIRASFQASGKTPVLSDKLMMHVIMGIRAFWHFFNSFVGIESRLHVFDADFLIRSLTVSSVTGENSVRGLTTSLTGSGSPGVSGQIHNVLDFSREE